jgi:hypothetical protein
MTALSLSWVKRLLENWRVTMIKGIISWLKRDHELRTDFKFLAQMSLAMMAVVVNFFLIAAVLGNLTSIKPAALPYLAHIVNFVVIDLVAFALSAAFAFIGAISVESEELRGRVRLFTLSFLAFIFGLIWFLGVAAYTLQFFATLTG